MDSLKSRAEKLLEAINHISMGDLELEIYIEGSDIISQIALAVNDMRLSLISQLEENRINTKKIQQEQIKIKSILESIPSPIFIVDKDFKITFINDIGANLVGDKPNKIVNKFKCMDIFKSNICKTKCAIKDCINKDSIITDIEAEIEKKEGGKLPIMITAAPLKDTAGNVIGGLEIFRDISNIKKLEREKEEAKKQYLKERTEKIIEPLMAISMGDLDTEIPIEGDDEITQIALAVNDMIMAQKAMLEQIELSKKEEEKKKKREYLESKVSNILSGVNKVAEGDLSIKIETGEDDEDIIIALSSGINKMIESLKKVIKQLTATIQEISSSTTEIAATNEEITLKTNEEIKFSAEASSTVTELTASIRQVADNSNKVAEQSNGSLKIVKDEYKHIGETINKIRETNKIVKKSAEDLMNLNESAGQIQDILNIINKIGEKTDLLALNAAIEASGAGEAGKRFRVVADEMRRLADNSLKSSKKIEDVLTTIQKGIGNNVDLMKNNAKDMADVMLEMDKIGETMKKVVQTFEESARLMKEVSLATNQQAEGTEMFSNVIEQVNVAANDTVKGIENSKIAIEKFIEISNNLKEIADKFRV